MSYFTPINAVLMLLFYVKCFSFILFIVRRMNYLSWNFLLVVTVPLVTPPAVTLLLNLPLLLVVPCTNDRLLYYRALFSHDLRDFGSMMSSSK
jgi:hypothetical protein